MSQAPASIHREDGQALVEFALVAPVLVVILFAVISFGKAINYWNDANQLSGEAARYAAVNRKPNPASSATLQAQIQQQSDTGELRNGGTADVSSPSQVCVDFPIGTSLPGDPVRVTTTFVFNWMPVLHIGFASTRVSASAVMRLEGSPTNYAAGCS